CRMNMIFFFFSSRRRHTRCLSDWSSDVCSSDLLWNTAGGLGGIALAWLLDREQARAAEPAPASSARPPHFAPKAKRVVQIFCCRSEERRVGEGESYMRCT